MKSVTWNFYPNKPDFYVIDILSEQHFADFFGNFENDPSFNPKAKYLITGSNFSSNILDTLIRHYILNVVFVDVISKEILTFFPYVANSFNIINLKLEPISFCGKNGYIEFEDDLFPRKTPKVWHQSTIVAAYLPTEVYSLCHQCKDKGVEIEILDLISNFFDLKLKYYSSNDTKYFNEALHDVSFGGQNVRDFIQCTTPYFQDEVVFFVPSAQSLPRWRYIFSIFSTSVWSLWFGTVLFASLPWILGNFIMHHKISFQETVDVSSLAFNWFLEKSCKIKRGAGFKTLLAISVLFLSNMMNFFFRSRLTYLLNGLNYDENINTFDEIIKSGLKIGATQDGANLINASSEVAEYLKTNYVRCRGTECLSRTAYERDLASFAMVAVAHSRSNNFIEEGTGRPLLIRINSPSTRRLLCFYFTWGHPLFTLYDENLQRLAESGILMKIYLKYVRMDQIEAPSLSARQSLNFGHMVAPLCMWFIGIILSIVALLCEIICAKKYFRTGI
ncbi:hypothetical protein WA026_006729 [Henosepilachna vigintioctopunctata]|uniref:Ionotropic receptor n=1 Tax=Henosepilachna vigintioctopunctata TaxID=420089 RepID=A0AAW1UAI8_9CUCU